LQRSAAHPVIRPPGTWFVRSKDASMGALPFC
jgi:hypothetical protein